MRQQCEAVLGAGSGTATVQGACREQTTPVMLLLLLQALEPRRAALFLDTGLNLDSSCHLLIPRSLWFPMPEVYACFVTSPCQGSEPTSGPTVCCATLSAALPRPCTALWAQYHAPCPGWWQICCWELGSRGWGTPSSMRQRGTSPSWYACGRRAPTTFWAHDSQYQSPVLVFVTPSLRCPVQEQPGCLP